jgi:serine/threonine-protein kinase RsbW
LQGTIPHEKKPHPEALREATPMKPDMQLALPARAENIAIVRHAFGAIGETYALDTQTLSDIRLAVTEACTNVVVHAYPDGGEGPMEVLASLLGDELTVVVRDEGRGVGPRPDSPGLGLGLPLIASLTESVQLGRDSEDRTEVRMTFSLSDRDPRLLDPEQTCAELSDPPMHL